MSSPTSLHSSRIGSPVLMFKGFNQRGQVSTILRDFDNRLNQSVADRLALESGRLTEPEWEERETELRKQALFDEVKFEKRLAKAYRTDYEKKLPKKYLKQAVRCIKNMLERVRFYGYSPSTVPVKDYAPPFNDQKGGRKFTELENKSWASISESGDEREPGWYQSTTPKADIMRWLRELDEATDTTERAASRLKRNDATQAHKPTSPHGKHRITSLEALATCPHKKSRASSGKQSSKRPDSSGRGAIVAGSKPPDEEPVDTTDYSSRHTPYRSEWSQSPKSIFSEAEQDTADEQQMFPFGTEEEMGFISAPTPGGYTSPSPALPTFDWFPPQRVSPVPSRWQSRVPTPGLDHREELKEALQKSPMPISDITHYFNLSHQGTKGERGRALFRLSRDIAQDKEIDIDQYLTGSGPSSRQASPHSESGRSQSQSGPFEEDENLDIDAFGKEMDWYSLFGSEPDTEHKK